MSTKRAPGRPPVEATDPDATRHLILHAALDLFQAHNYTDVSMAAIAEAAGLTKATLYYHFKSKAEIVTDGIVESLNGVHDLVAHIFSQSDRSVYNRLTDLMDARREQIALISASQNMIDDMRTHLNDGQRGVIDQAHRHIIDQFTGLMQEGIQRSELKPLDPAVLGVIFQHLMGIEASATPDSQHIIDALILQIFFEGAGR